MGWKGRLAAGFMGLVSLGAGLWFVGIVCFLYLAYSFFPRGPKKPTEKAQMGTHLPPRLILAGILFILSAVAVLSGGISSPLVFLVGGMIALLWPALRVFLPFSEVTPIPNTILLRSRYSPIGWFALAEFKPGPETFARAVSSYAGKLLVFTETGRAYALVSCITIGRKEAEVRVLSQLRSCAPSSGAFLLPLDSQEAAGVLRLKLSHRKLPREDLAEAAPRMSGVLVLECNEGRVVGASSCEVEGPSPSSRVPGKGTGIEGSPLIWEVLDGLGRRTKWPDPDAYSNLLDSMTATRGVPLGERIGEMESSGGQVTVRSLGGEEVSLSRSQLRAIISIYA